MNTPTPPAAHSTIVRLRRFAAGPGLPSGDAGEAAATAGVAGLSDDSGTVSGVSGVAGTAATATAHCRHESHTVAESGISRAQDEHCFKRTTSYLRYTPRRLTSGKGRTSGSRTEVQLARRGRTGCGRRGGHAGGGRK